MNLCCASAAQQPIGERSDKRPKPSTVVRRQLGFAPSSPPIIVTMSKTAASAYAGPPHGGDRKTTSACSAQRIKDSEGPLTSASARATPIIHERTTNRIGRSIRPGRRRMAYPQVRCQCEEVGLRTPSRRGSILQGEVPLLKSPQYRCIAQSARNKAPKPAVAGCKLCCLLHAWRMWHVACCKCALWLFRCRRLREGLTLYRCGCPPGLARMPG